MNPPMRPYGFWKDNTQYIRLLKLFRPITAKDIAAIIEIHPIARISNGNLETSDKYISNAPSTSLTTTAKTWISSFSNCPLRYPKIISGLIIIAPPAMSVSTPNIMTTMVIGYLCSNITPRISGQTAGVASGLVRLHALVMRCFSKGNFRNYLHRTICPSRPRPQPCCTLRVK